MSETWNIEDHPQLRFMRTCMEHERDLKMNAIHALDDMRVHLKECQAMKLHLVKVIKEMKENEKLRIKKEKKVKRDTRIALQTYLDYRRRQPERDPKRR